MLLNVVCWVYCIRELHSTWIIVQALPVQMSAGANQKFGFAGQFGHDSYEHPCLVDVSIPEGLFKRYTNVTK